MSRTAMFVAAVAATVVLALAAGSATASPTTVKPSQRALGKSIGDWIGTWYEHYLELPVSENPLVGNGSRCGGVGKVLMPVYAPCPGIRR